MDWETNAGELGAIALPTWWRCALIAVATLVFCSCSVPLPIDVDAEWTDSLSTVVEGEPTEVVVEGESVVVEGESVVVEGESIPVETGVNLGDITPPNVPTWINIVTDQYSGELAGEGVDEFQAHDFVGITDEGAYPVSEYIDGEYIDNLCGVGGCPTCDGAVPVDAAWVGPGDEYLCDGGDFGSPAGVRADWTIDGLDQEDAIAHYDTLDGRVILTPSNRVCLYAPRFAAVRQVVNPLAHEQPVFINVNVEEKSPAGADESLPVVSSLQRHAPRIDLGQQPPSLYRQRQQAGGLENLQATMDAYDALPPYASLEVVRTGVVDNAEKPWLALSIESAIALTGVQAPQVLFGVKAAQAEVGVRQPGVIYQTDGPDSPRLRLIKLASCSHALPGEVIEFTLRFDNIGDQKIGNVTIVDNLSTRFEYIANSAKSSLDAKLITMPNDGDSTILRWEIKDPLEPGAGGILRFRVRVR